MSALSGNKIVCLLLLFAAAACGRERHYVITEVNNAKSIPNTLFINAENISMPRFQQLKEKYRLDTVLRGETNELKRILLRRHWIKSKMKIGVHDLYDGPYDPNTILDSAARGSTFHCGHFMAVQNAVLNAFGYVTRCVGSGPGVPGAADQHHAMNEVWLNDYQKWFMCDAKYDHHFERHGKPLSALEVRGAFLVDSARDIDMMSGPGRTPTETDDDIHETKAQFAQTFTWLEWEQHNDRYSVLPEVTDHLLMIRDPYTETHRWLWNGKPHWAIGTDVVQYTSTLQAIEWTPNVVSASASIHGDEAELQLYSQTPNWKTYQIKTDRDSEWKNCTRVINIRLKGLSRIEIRSVNAMDVAGPVQQYRITF